MLDKNFPVHTLPSLARNAIYEVEQHTQAPLSLISSAILSAISLACQNSIDVCRINNLIGPASLYLLTIADSGERKTGVYKEIFNPIYEFEELLFEKHLNEMLSYKNTIEIMDIEKKLIISKIKSDIRCNRDVSETRKRLEELLSSYPEEPIKYRMIFNDATPAALKDYLSGHWRSVGIFSDEAGTVFNGYILGDLPFLNKMWDGSTYTLQRKNEPDRLIKNATLTAGLMAQPSVISRYIKNKGDIAKGIGIFNRFLICQPHSKQGYRTITNPVTSNEHLPLFHKRLMEIIKKNIASNKNSKRTCLYFSPEAQERWIQFHNHVESEMGMLGFGCFSDIKDYASKIAENAARISALLFYFNHGEGDISLEAIEAAIEITLWFTDEYIRIFSVPKPLDKKEEQIDSEELFKWVIKYCEDNSIIYFNKVLIYSFGPNRLRRKKVADGLLEILVQQGKIRIAKRGRSLYIGPDIDYMQSISTQYIV
ncbi:YfjI family protein [Cronobacter sakazakii]|uniref:YfjI family protein n=1 Tax=Cronobacter sakazakii TaxID=28141 RepID=UPI0030B9E40C